MLAWGQYISYLVAGALYYFMLAAFFSLAAGFSASAIVLVILAAVLGGYASGLSFVIPRLAAAVGGVISLIFLLYCIGLAFSLAGGASYILIALPSLAAVILSVFAIRSPQTSMWFRQQTRAGKVALSFTMLLPALLATYVILYIMSNLLE